MNYQPIWHNFVSVQEKANLQISSIILLYCYIILELNSVLEMFRSFKKYVTSQPQPCAPAPEKAASQQGAAGWPIVLQNFKGQYQAFKIAKMCFSFKVLRKVVHTAGGI